MDNPIIAIIVIFIGSVVIAILAFWLSSKMTGGRGILYKFVQDYGYDDYRTLDALLDVMGKIIYHNEGMRTGGKISLWHDVGNRYVGDYWEDGETRHDLIVNTDGWHIEYQIDNNPPKKGKI